MEYLHLDKWHEFPELNRLKELPKPPKSLYIQDNFNPAIFKNCVTIVGSRRMTNYGRQVIDKLVPQLVFQGKTIVSGFMYGVDQYVHQVCLDSGGKTIAVLGWGIDTKLEDYDQKLAQQIIATGGVLLSEWETQKGTLWTFPVRDRIVAALSDEIYVIEAALKSGSLITADIALKLNKKIFAIPGPITSKTSQGTNMLIAQGKASMWTGQQATQQLPLLSADPIISLLETEALTTDEIALKLKRPISEIGAKLSLFSLSGQVTEREGKYYLCS